jgi:hypothetical protein
MMLVGVTAGLAIIVASLAWLVVSTVNPSSHGVPTPSGQASGQVQGRDAIAAAPLPSVDPSVAFQSDPSLKQAGSIEVPGAVNGRGPAGVATGFPHTAGGAVGQLGAIESAVIEAMDLGYTREVHGQWVMAGGPSFEAWSQTAVVRSFLAGGAQSGQGKDVTTMVTAQPVAAMVKGVDGPDWVLACVLMDVKASIKTDARAGYGTCARMQWSGDRWLIGAGAEPAQAPSTWPGSQAAVDVGWLTWKEA